MIGGQLQYIVAQERIAELHRVADAARLAVPVAAEPPKSRSNPIRELLAQLGRLTARSAGGKAMRLETPGADRATDDGLVLADRTRIRLRPLGPEDRAALTALFARLSPESRYRRFLSPKRELTPRELTFFTDIDHVYHEAFAAVDRRDGSIVGVGRYVHEADRAGVASVAVEVADELQGMGIGTALTRCVVQRARVNGFALLTATALWENRPARALLRRLGFRARGRDRGVIELELELDSMSGGVAGATS